MMKRNEVCAFFKGRGWNARLFDTENRIDDYKVEAVDFNEAESTYAVEYDENGYVIQ